MMMMIIIIIIIIIVKVRVRVRVSVRVNVNQVFIYSNDYSKLHNQHPTLTRGAHVSRQMMAECAFDMMLLSNKS